MDEALTRWLSEQMSAVYVKVLGWDKEVTKVALEVVKSGAMGQHLKGLSVELGSDDEVQLLCGAMAEGKRRGLEELDLCFHVRDAREYRDKYTCGGILYLLAQGTWPHLRRLHLVGCDRSIKAGKMLVKAIESGHVGQHLEDLELSKGSLGSAGLTSNGLRRLSLKSCHPTR